MTRHDDDLKEDEKHKTARDLALYMRNEGKYVGRHYAKHSEIWNVPEDRVQTGLLHLILDTLEEMVETDQCTRSKRDPLDIHRDFLNDYYRVAMELFSEYEKQRMRLIAMFGEDIDLGHDMHNNLDIHEISRLYRESRYRSECIHYLGRKISRLKSVRKPEDVSNLYGIGKKKSMRILQKLKAREQ